MKTSNKIQRRKLLLFDLFLMALVLILAALELRAQTVSVQLVAVLDGDTVRLKLDNNYQFNARLIGVDAPELAQQDGQVCKAKLIELTNNQTLRIYQIARDKFGRDLVQLLRSDYSEINVDLLRAGCAWKEGARRRDAKRYKLAEREARINKSILWNYIAPIPGGGAPIPGGTSNGGARVAPCRPKKFREGKCPEQN